MAQPETAPRVPPVVMGVDYIRLQWSREWGDKHFKNGRITGQMQRMLAAVVGRSHPILEHKRLVDDGLETQRVRVDDGEVEGGVALEISVGVAGDRHTQEKERRGDGMPGGTCPVQRCALEGPSGVGGRPMPLETLQQPKNVPTFGLLPDIFLRQSAEQSPFKTSDDQHLIPEL